MLTKHRYDRNVLNSNKWKDSTARIPTQKTHSGAEYDIVSNSMQDLRKANNSSIFTKRVVNRGKSITEYADF